MRNLFYWIIMLVVFLTFCTKDSDPPIGSGNRVHITTQAVTNITSDSALTGGEVKSDGGEEITKRGVCWSTISQPTDEDSKFESGYGLGAFTIKLKGLLPNHQYFVRAYAINRHGAAYGNEVAFKTPAALPSVVAQNINAITSTSASVAVNVTADGGASVNQRGVCWNTSSLPTIANSRTVNGSGTGSFTSSLTGLAPNTTYYIRAYATNSVGTSYSAQLQFTTPTTIPNISATTVATTITSFSAYSGGIILSDGGSAVTAKGVCWSTSVNPTTINSKTNNGTGIANFSSYINGLISNTTYYVRAYAINANGTAYGPQIQFKTLGTVPALSTTSASSISLTSAYSGGSITSDGGSVIIARGICWATSANPDIYDYTTTNGSGTGAYTSALTGLSPNTTYYVRAYATNAYGTSYGQQIQFTTLGSIPTINTIAPSSISITSAYSGGSIISDGGSPITAKGVCWSTSGTPSIFNNKTIDGSGTSSFSSYIYGLNSNTTYYVRAYATNSVGTSYGATYTFTTSLATPTLTSPSNYASFGCCYISLQWGSIANVTEYEVQISKNSSFTGTAYSLATSCSASPLSTYLNVASTTSNSLCIRGGGSSNNGTWYWRVRAKNGSSYSAWSATGAYYYYY